MKSIKLIIVALMLMAGVSMSAQNTITATEAHITINGQTTRENLAQIKSDLNAQGIVFNYAPDFDGQRRLVGLRYSVITNNGELTGEGYHKTLQNPNSKVTFHINKTAGTFSEDIVGDLSRN
jgi:ABC-type lipoprotein release transport system permease subunit